MLAEITTTLTEIINSEHFGLISHFLSGLMILFLIHALFRVWRKGRRLKKRFKGIIDIEEETKKVFLELTSAQKKLENEHASFEQKKQKLKKDLEAEELASDKRTKKLKEDYASKRSIYEQLLREINILEENVEFISFGMYQPHFNLEDSERYKFQLTKVRNEQKELVKQKIAAVCSTKWSVGDSKREGQKMINGNIKLMLRAFNNECDSSLLKVKWDNVSKMEARINKAYEAINKLGETNHISITDEYLNVRLKELYLTHEYQEKLNEEKEEQKRIKEQIKEEEKVQREIEKANKESEQEEKQYMKALEKARREVDKARKEAEESQGEALTELNDQVKELELMLEEAQQKGIRATSMAQLTKSGHVYVISNLGSFGDDVFKIGMTRRLEPNDRVRELGGASVPFRFDVHAMIYSENAPELENQLHKAFKDKRVNLINARKEFFNVSLNEIEAVVKKNKGSIEFTKIAEAREYRESIAIRSERNNSFQKSKELEEKFPTMIA